MSKDYFISYSIKNKVTGEVDFDNYFVSFHDCEVDGPSSEEFLEIQKMLKDEYLEKERKLNLTFPEDGIKVTILFYKRI